MGAEKTMIVNALSVDVEEYYNGMEFEAAVPVSERHRLPSRVEMSVDLVLDLLVAYDLRATFFIVGEVAEAHPATVRRISQASHELACHSYRHELISHQSPEEFRADVRQAKSVVEVSMVICFPLIGDGYNDPLTMAQSYLNRNQNIAAEGLCSDGHGFS